MQKSKYFLIFSKKNFWFSKRLDITNIISNKTPALLSYKKTIVEKKNKGIVLKICELIYFIIDVEYIINNINEILEAPEDLI